MIKFIPFISGFLKSLRNIGCTVCPEEKCDLCKCGFMQSPIEISTKVAEPISLTPLKFTNHFESETRLLMYQIDNTVRIVSYVCPMTIEGGPLICPFSFDHLYFHWGDNDKNGTDHVIDYNKFAMEVHIVYFNANFVTVSEAYNLHNGIVVLSILLKSTSNENPEFEYLTEQLQLLKKCPGLGIKLDKNIFTIFKEILNSNEYYIYEGSLMSTPCPEQVIHIVFKQTLDINCNQVTPFRNLCNKCCEKIQCNVRDKQPRNGRKIYITKN